MNAMLAQPGTNAYQQVNRFSGIENATAHQLIEMLLKGALDKIAMAKGYMARNNLQEKGEAITKSIAIVQELHSSLNLEEGGELAQNLESLYDYVSLILLAANQKNDATKLDEATSILNNIYNAWISIPEAERI